MTEGTLVTKTSFLQIVGGDDGVGGVVLRTILVSARGVVELWVILVDHPVGRHGREEGRPLNRLY